MKQVVAFAGGKDSTAMALRLAELGEDFSLLFTPTKNELPELEVHLARMVELVGKPLILPENKSLEFWIAFHDALPNWRQRWCTRQIKIEPCIAYLKANPGTKLLVGLRADEPGREGLYGDFATYRYPMREWGWNITDVWNYLRDHNIKVPLRTDCAVCFYQTIPEWFRLWRDHPDEYAKGEAWEAKVGHTFRSPQRDTWPAALKDLRAEFERGRLPRGMKKDDEEADDAPKKCRVCSV